MDDVYPPVKRPAWRQLGDLERARAWDLFYAKFDFQPSGGTARRVIADPDPSVTFDLGTLMDGADQTSARDLIEATARRAFLLGLPEADEILVLDWMHPAWALTIAVEILDADPRDPVNGYPSVYPDGDYYIYANVDLNEGTFGHPWEPSLCVFGEQMVATLGRSLATWLPVKRFTGDIDWASEKRPRAAP